MNKITSNHVPTVCPAKDMCQGQVMQVTSAIYSQRVGKHIMCVALGDRRYWVMLESGKLWDVAPNAEGSILPEGSQLQLIVNRVADQDKT